MNLDGIEQLLVAQLKKRLPPEAIIRPGPVVALPLGGMRPTVFVHGARFDDLDGKSREGARIGRRRVEAPGRTGIAEERPAKITIEVVCVASAYTTVKTMSEVVSPAVLRELSAQREFLVASTASQSSRLTFADFQPVLHQAETTVKEESDLSYHCSRMVFHLNGFLHTRITKKGGLQPAAKAANKKAAKKKKAKRKQRPSQP